MSQLKKHILRKTYIVVGSFLLGVTTTVFAAVGIDVLSIAERASSVIDEFRSEASKIEDQKTYYSLARADLALLYNEVDRQLAELAGETQNSSNNQSQVIESKIAIVGPGPGTGNINTQTVCGTDSSPSIVGPAVRRCNTTTRQWYTDNGNGSTSNTGDSTQSQSSCNWNSPVACGTNEFQCSPANAGKTTACHTCICTGISTTTYTSDANLTTKTTSYKKGQKLYGYVEGGDLDNVWACIDLPGANSCKTNNCSSGYEQGTCPWRQLTKNYTRGNSDTSGKDGWQKNGNRIEYKSGLTIETSWPTGTYYGYTRNGINGTVVSTSFIVEDNQNPITVFTDNSLVTSKSIFFKGEKLFGYISGGNPDNTWGCTDIPGETKCVSSNAGWRQLTKPYPGVTADEWQKNPAKGNRIELKDGFMLFPGFPTGVYKSYTRDGINGTPQVVNFEVKERVMNCSWGTTLGGCNPGVCSSSNVGAQACGGTCRCN